ncbi:MAG TPA: glucosidase [Myxococcota bacterium]|jgi:hypothetical protein|nr:glucosidase [Myxococcota bacterium]
MSSARASDPRGEPAAEVVPCAEERRLAEDASRQRNWKRWGPYLSERQWATVREDYSPHGEAWTYFPHDHARSRAYRWGEDGLLGFTDRECRLCLAIGLWNERDPILKERLFGLTGPEGNHGEDVKEAYFYLDTTPTHSYAKSLYKYPQAAFPYAKLVEENGRRGRGEREYELVDTGVFENDRYFDVLAEYAKAGPNDLLLRLTIANRGPAPARLHVLPQLWFRNSWSWGRADEDPEERPQIALHEPGILVAEHATLGRFRFAYEAAPGGAMPDVLFTENDTNEARLYGAPNATPYVKDAFDRYVVHGERDAVNPERRGTKAAPHYVLEVPAGRSVVLRVRLFSEAEAPRQPFGAAFERVFADRIAETDEFYDRTLGRSMTADERNVARQAAAGLLFSKQFFHYVVRYWLEGDPTQPSPPPERWNGRNKDWHHLYNRDVISMPDKWEYPWYAAWDLAFHMVGMARLDPEFAKDQLLLLLREWYMHPNGQLPAYEFAFGDVNPPVHAWAAWRVYKMTAPRGKRDRTFLRRVFDKLVINFTWWVNRKDTEGKHVFGGGFLGLDNIGVFDRSQPLPTGGHLEQADGTAWMAFYCSTMLAMAIELAQEDPVYEDIASKFFEHFTAISDAMNRLGGTGLWDELDGFYYDELHVDGREMPLRVRSLVGLVPLFAAWSLPDAEINKLPGFEKRMRWFLEHRADLAQHISYLCTIEGEEGPECKRLLAIPSEDRLRRVLLKLLDESEFLSPYGVRALSRFHEQHPFVFHAEGQEYRVDYVPGEGSSGLFGGNSNWRGPIWMPMNFLVVEALERYQHFYGDAFDVELPVGSGKRTTLRGASLEIARRLTRLFLRDANGARPCHAGDPRYANDPHWRDYLVFPEYFHADLGHGLGARYQGWTFLVALLIADVARARHDETR